ncbi:MAG: hypothetical protein K2Q45_06800 [Nitrosomonas sp.]|nr:hypothetical protein [Nitrosomonas sp.]
MDTNLAPSQGLDFYAAGIASGRTDIFETFLGPPVREQKTSPYAKKSVAKWNMPENYVGENLYLRDTVEDLMLTAAWDFWTERILPWFKTDQISLQWTEWDNNPHYMGITPHQAVSRVVTQRRTIRKASIVRRGIAAEFELDFVTTPLGRQSFNASVGQISRSIQETGNVEVLRALLGCHKYQQVYIRKHGVVANEDLDGWLQRKADRFMACQKDAFGLEKLAVQVEQDQEQYGGKGNVWIVGREVADYCRFRDEKSRYYEGGQEAVDRVNNRLGSRAAAGNTMGNVRSLEPQGMISDTPVYFAKSMSVDSIGKAELLSRTVEVGVYNMMVDRTRDFKRYRSEGRNLRVYDNDIDNWSEIELATAIEKCGIWKTNDGKLAPIFDSKKMRADAMANQEGDLDFLSYYEPGSKQRKEIQYIGEMSSTYLKPTDLINAGQTVLNAMSNGDEQEAKTILKDLNGAIANSKEPISREKLATSAGKYPELVRNLLGENNYFLKDNSGSAISSFIDNFVTPHLIHVVPSNAASIGAAASTGSAAQIADEEYNFLTRVIGAVVPDDHRTAVEKIASEANKAWTERAQMIKDVVLKCQREKPETLDASLAQPADIDKWHNKRVSEFKTRLEKKFGAAAAAGTASAPAVAGEVHYLPAGSSIPSGWTVVQQPTGRITARMAAFATPTPVATASAAGGARRGLLGAHLEAPGARGSYTPQEKAAMDAADKAPRTGGANIMAHVLSLQSTSAPLALKILGCLYLGCTFEKETFLGFARNHIYACLGFLLMRANATYITRFGIKVAANGEAGFTVFGHGSMNIETTAANKVGLMHYTTYLSAVVTNPKNVYVVEDLYCQKYLGGMGVEFWSPEEYKNAISRRAKSIICAPLPPNFKKIEQKIDIRGRWYTEQKAGLVSQERFEKPLYPGARRVDILFGISEKFSKQTRKVAMNTVCWQGKQKILCFYKKSQN